MQPGEAVYRRSFNTSVPACASRRRASTARRWHASPSPKAAWRSSTHRASGGDRAVRPRSSETHRREDPAAVVMVESALVFETKHAGTRELAAALRQGGAGHRSGRGEDRAIRRARAAAGADAESSTVGVLENEARRRLAQQIPDERKIALSDYVLTNADRSRAGVAGRPAVADLAGRQRQSNVTLLRSAQRPVQGHIPREIDTI